MGADIHARLLPGGSALDAFPPAAGADIDGMQLTTDPRPLTAGPLRTLPAEADTVTADRRVAAPAALPAQSFVFPSFTTRRPFARTGHPRSAAVAWNRKYARIITAADALVVFAAALAGHLVWFGLAPAPLKIGSFTTTYLVVSAVVGCAWMLALHVYRSRDPRITGIGTDEYKRVINASVVLLGSLALATVVFQFDVSRGYFGLVFPTGVGGLICSRWLLRQWLQAQRQRGRYLSKVVVLGRPRDVRYVVHQINAKSRAAYQVVGVVLTGKKREYLDVDGTRLPVVADERKVVDAAARLRVDAVIVAGPTKGGSRYVQELGWELEESSTQLILTTGLTNVAGPRIHSRPVEGLPLMHVELPQYAGGKHVLKRGLDIVLSGAALVALVPVFLLLAVLVRRDSPGPALFRQERVGRGGEVFEMLKFRSMVQTAEDDLAGLLDRNEGSGVLFKMQQDPRVTRVGRWMRKYSLDELPQLWNVFLGHMSLVGPRPPLPREVAQYGNRVHRRLYIKPGLTGMWQINGRSELNWKDGVRLDLYYVENWSLAGDLIILWRTVQMLRRPVGAY
ncbi:sugar transferase [Arthrobacter zhaoxinii]|uniref:Sugar transferase n=1 Tax=Arthrobacter zhaoxinii TaxID=2964616 RepID=A0ABY5YUQ3_9MICC|nr:sugar transferase [Arthrobacter zhaoxinii]UWX97966.1 sugar transferase [Arthrobacter zhaoxinii]